MKNTVLCTLTLHYVLPVSYSAAVLFPAKLQMSLYANAILGQKYNLGSSLHYALYRGLCFCCSLWVAVIVNVFG